MRALRTASQNRILILLLYLFGVLHWYLFMQLGDAGYNVFDWRYVHQWLAIVKLALENGRAPYHVAYYSEEIATGNFMFGDRYFALPFLIASPQILALAFLSIANWMTLQVLLIYTAGFWGLVKWIRKLELSASAAVFLIILFSFNGFHSSRIGVGHLQNISYFLVPWVLWIINGFIEAEYSSIRQKSALSLQLAFLLLFVFLQGSSQLVPNIMLVGLCILLFYVRQIGWYVLGGAIGLVLSSYIVWPVLFFSPYSSMANRIVYAGYGGGSLESIIRGLYYALTRLYTAATDASWESDAYVSLLGVLLIAAGCAGVWFKRRSLAEIPLLSLGFISGMFIVGLLALDGIYARLWSLLQHVYALPAIDRLPTRLIIYPLTYVILVASLGFDQVFEIVRTERLKSGLKWLSLSVLLVLLMQHSWLWSLSNTALEWFGNPDSVRSKLTFGARILNHGGDDSYMMTVNVSYLVSFVTAISALAGYAYLRRRVLRPA